MIDNFIMEVKAGRLVKDVVASALLKDAFV